MWAIESYAGCVRIPQSNRFSRQALRSWSSRQTRGRRPNDASRRRECAGELSRANLARALRSGGRSALPLTVYASMLGHLLLRTLARGERIHLAMASRGFTGDALPGAGRDWSWRDTAFVALCWACFLAARLFNPSQALGELLTGAWT